MRSETVVDVLLLVPDSPAVVLALLAVGCGLRSGSGAAFGRACGCAGIGLERGRTASAGG